MNKNKILFRFVNTERYASLLEHVPHRELGDLSVVYFEYNENKSRVISNREAVQEQISETELYELAKRNGRELFPPCVSKVSDYIREHTNEPVEDLPIDNELFVITNEDEFFGATAILYEDVMEDVASQVGSDLYLLPSSVDEFLAISVNCNRTIEMLEQMVHEINFTQVNMNNRLSNQVYHYDRTTQQITQATNSPYGRLDSVRPEWLEEQVYDEEQVESEQCAIGMVM